MFNRVWLALESQYCIVWVIFILRSFQSGEGGGVGGGGLGASLVYPLACNSLYKKKSIFCKYIV